LYDIMAVAFIRNVNHAFEIGNEIKERDGVV
jgi:hypothetical protein